LNVGNNTSINKFHLLHQINSKEGWTDEPTYILLTECAQK
jgi:hypothetical protein